MAWSDKPTETQLITILDWIKWRIPRKKALAAIDYLRDNASRGDVSVEMGRIRTLHFKKQLDDSTCFESEIWRNFKYDSKSSLETLKEMIKERSNE